MILAGDIGGTKTLLGLFTAERGGTKPIRQRSFPSQQYTSLEQIIAEFLADGPERPTSGAFAVAGPVMQGTARITNLPWFVDAAAINKQFNTQHIHLLNDVQGTAAAVPYLGPEYLSTLRTGAADPTGAIVVIAPGTGLGEAFLTWNGQRYVAHPTEGGHSSYAPGSAEEVQLLYYLYPRFGHISYERVCSGIGIPNLYDFQRSTNRFEEPEWLKAQLAAVTDPTPIIVNTALNRQADICSATLDLFVRILASEVGNMALNVLATGGIFLGGGIPPRILARLQQPDFVEATTQKGRFKRLLESIPLHVILDPQVTLHGAAFEALALQQE